MVPHFEYAVIAFAVGIGLYFALPAEPDIKWMSLFAVLFAVLAIVIAGRLSHYSLIIILTCFAVFGLWRSSWHTDTELRPVLPDYERVYDVSGRITAIEKSGPRLRWVIKVKSIGWIKATERPEFIRVTTFDKTFEVGDSVSFRAQMKAPPNAVIPGGYNPAFRALYDRVGGYGFMLSRPERIPIAELTISEKLSVHIGKFRFGMARRILAAAPEDTAGLQVALLTGIRTWVPDDHTEALRTAGLAHILAISGLHMGLIAGGIYGVALWLLVRVNYLARRRDVRKIAAMIGLLAATFYLVLSGASVATQRAFIMTSIVFIALILDRQAISIRSVAVAGFITLWLHPEALVSPGFQMSFSAVIALVVVYREWDKRRVFRGRPGFFGRVWQDFKALSVTSLVAGTATSGFAVLHFNRIAVYGFFANLLAMPFFTFWVMPVALLVYLGLLFGVEALPLWVMGKGISIIISISEWVEAWPGALKFMASGPFWLMGVFGLAYTGLCIGSAKVRYVSLAVLVFCFATLFFRPEADIRISEQGALAFWNNSSVNTLYVDRKNSDRYGRQEFIEAMGVGTTAVMGYDGKIGKCDDRACFVEFKGKKILVVSDPSEIMEDCELADLIIVPKRDLGARARRLCARQVIDGTDLRRLGAHSVTIGAGNAFKIRTARRSVASRPWH